MPGKEPPEVAIARIEGKTARTIARWSGLRRVVPALAGAAATVVSADQVTQEDSSVNAVLVTIIIVLGLALVALGVKVWWDRREKQRLRGIITTLEDENRRLDLENANLTGQIAALQPGTGGQVP